MGVKKKAVDLKTKTAVDEMRSFLATGQSAQATMEEFEDPEQIHKQFEAGIVDYCRKLKRHQLFFQEKKINPFRRLQEICQHGTLKFLDDFDKVAGMKAK